MEGIFDAYCVAFANFFVLYTVEHTAPNLGDVMVFLTGCSTVPPMGYKERNPTITFVETGMFPTVSTCALNMQMPLTLPIDFKEFKERMDTAILDSQGFFGSL